MIKFDERFKIKAESRLLTLYCIIASLVVWWK